MLKISFCYILARFYALEKNSFGKKKNKGNFFRVILHNKFSQKRIRSNILLHDIPSRTALFPKSADIILNGILPTVRWLS